MNKIINNHSQDIENNEKLVTIMVTELENSSYVDSIENDAVKHREHHKIVNLAIRLNNGVLLKSIDDDMLFRFDSVQDAISAAIEIQKDIDRFNMVNKFKKPILMRISLHSGKSVDNDSEIPASLIDFSRHLKSLTLPGETFVSHGIYQAIDNKFGINFRLVNQTPTTTPKESNPIYKVLWNPQEVERDKPQNIHLTPNEKTAARFKFKRILIIVIPLLLVLLLTLREDIMSQITSESKSRVIHQSIEN